MLSDFQTHILGFDGMFPRTIKDVTIHPGKSAKKFIDGNRVLYYGPVGYFFLMIALMLLIMGMLDVDVVEFIRSAGQVSVAQTTKPGSGMAKFMESTLHFVSENLKLISFAVIPLQAFSLKYVFFRKSGYNFLEHTVMPFYVQGHVYWISIVSVIYYKFTGTFFPTAISGILAVMFFCYGCADFFHYQSKVKGFLKGLGVYLFSQFLFVIIIIIVVFGVVMLNPDVYEMVKPSNNR